VPGKSFYFQALIKKQPAVICAYNNGLKLFQQMNRCVKNDPKDNTNDNDPKSWDHNPSTLIGVDLFQVIGNEIEKEYT